MVHELHPLPAQLDGACRPVLPQSGPRHGHEEMRLDAPIRRMLEDLSRFFICRERLGPVAETPVRTTNVGERHGDAALVAGVPHDLE